MITLTMGLRMTGGLLWMLIQHLARWPARLALLTRTACWVMLVMAMVLVRRLR